MPLYLYQCATCKFPPREVLQEFNDPPPVCTHRRHKYDGAVEPVTMEKLLTAASFQFKGGGYTSR